MKVSYKHLTEDINLGTLASCEGIHAEDGKDQDIKGAKRFMDIAKSPNSVPRVDGAIPKEAATFQLLRDMMCRIASVNTYDISDLKIDPRCIVVDKEKGTVTILPYPIVVGDIEEGD